MISDQTIIAATDVEWEDSISDYPASEYDLELTIKRGSDGPKSLTVTKDGDTFQISIPNDLITPDEFGDYQFQYKFTNLTDFKIYAPITSRGFIKVLPDLSTDADTRTEDEKILESLISVRSEIAARGHVSVAINGKQATFKTLNEIDSAIVRYQKKLGIYKTPKLVSRFV